MTARRRAAIGLAALAAAVALGALLAHPLAGVLARRLAAPRAVALLESAGGGRARVERADIDPWRFQLVLEGVELEGGTGPLARLAIDRAVMRPSLPALLGGRVKPASLEIVGLRAVLDTARIGEGKQPFDPAPLSALRRLTVEDGRVAVGDTEVGFSVALEGLRIAAEPSRGGGAAGRLEAGPALLRIEPLAPQRFDRVASRVRWDAPELSLDGIEVVGAAAEAEGSLTLLFQPEGLRAGARFRVSGDAGRLLPDPAWRLSGRATAGGQFGYEGRGRWRVSADVEDLGGLEVRGVPIRDLSARVTATPDGVEIGRIALEAPGWGRVGPARVDRRGDGSLEADVTVHADLAALAEHALPAGLPIAGQLRLRARVTSPAGGPLAWDVEGVAAPEPPARGALSGTVVGFGGEERGRLTFEGAWGDRPLSALFEVADPLSEDRTWRVDARTGAAGETRVQRLIEAIEQTARAAGRPLPVPEPVPGGARAELAATASGRGRELRGLRVAASIERPEIGGTRFDSLEGALELVPGGLYRAAGRLAGRDGDGIFLRATGAPGRAQLEMALERVPSGPFVRWLGGGAAARFGALEGQATGHLSLELGAGGPRGAFVVDWGGQAPWGGPLRATGSGLVRGARLEATSLALDGSGLRVRYRGAIELVPGGPAIDGHARARAELASLPLAAGLRGTVEADCARLTSHGAWPLACLGDVRWRGAGIGDLDFPDGGADLEIGGERLRARAAAGPLTIDATLDRQARLSAEAAWNDAELGGFLEALLGFTEPLALSARTSGRLHLRGPAGEPRAWEGDGSIEALEIAGPTTTASLARAASLHLAPDLMLSIDPSAPLALRDRSGGLLTVSGGLHAVPGGSPALALTTAGTWGLGLIEAIEPTLLASGRLAGEVRIGGTVRRPTIHGALRLEEGSLRSLVLDTAVDRLSGRIAFDGARVRLEQARGELGGGTVRAAGELVLSGWTPERLEIGVEARDVALSIPRGIWGRYDADLAIAGPAASPRITGSVRVLDGLYSRPFAFAGPLARRARIVEPARGLSSWLFRVGLGIELEADRTLAVRNEMARLETSARLDVAGTLGNPLLAGTVSLLEGGTLTFRGLEYEVLSGQVVMDDVDAEPVRVRLRASTEVRDYRIRLDLDATTESVDYRLSSVPALTQEEILALLITGETLSELGSGGGLIDSDLATAYFGSQLGEMLLAEPMKRLFGISQVQLSPARVGPEARPTARLTLGQRLDDRTLALYSRDLSSEGRDLYRLEREIGRSLRLAVGGEASLGVSADLRWFRRLGEAPADGAREPLPERVVAGSVTVDGLPNGVSAPRAGVLGLKGERLTRAALLEARVRLRERLARAGYLEAEVTFETARRGRKEDVQFTVKPGPRWELSFNGPPRAVREATDRLAALWSTTRFGPERLREAERVLRDAFADEGRAAAVVAIARPDPEARRLEVRIDPGPRVSIAGVAFEGVTALRVEDVQAQVLSRPGGARGKVLYRPREVAEDVDAVRTLYESRGYLEARVETRVRFRGKGDEVLITFVVEEGRRARVGTVAVSGDWPADLGPATALIPLAQGEPFLPERLRAAQRALAEALDGAGHYESSVVARPEFRDGEVDVTFQVQAGPRATIESVELVGLSRTRQKLVERHIALREGEPLSRRDLRRTERELFRLGLFRGVTIGHAPHGGDPSRRDVTIRFEEVPPLSLLVSVGYDTEEQIRITGAVSHDNIAGLGRTGSLQGFLSSRRRGVRATIEDPYQGGGRLEALAALGLEEETREGFTVRTAGLTLQLGSRGDRTRRWQLRYELDENSFRDVSIDAATFRQFLLTERAEDIRLAALRGTYTLDRRDDLFRPRRGWVTRVELGLWQGLLGSQADFGRATGQIAGYEPVGRRWTLAGSLRAGFSEPFGGTRRVPLSERLFAGGAESLRGFERDRLGPLDPLGGDPLGGESLLLLNLEARWRVWGDFEAVLFHDRGNVWIDARSFDPTDLRATVGAAIRWNTPVGALRLGYGYKLDRRPDESPGELFISIGEPF